MRTAPSMQLSRNINLYSNRASAAVNISFPGIIYGYTTSGLYTFTNNADVRYLSFNAICSATEFTNFASAYMNYKIQSCSVIINPLSVNTGTTLYPLLSLSCEPEDSSISTNPTNSDMILRDQNHLFNAQANTIKSVTFTFPSVGVNTNIWQDTTNLPSKGIFTIGNNSTTNWFGGGNVAVFEYMISLLVVFNGAK